MKKLICLVFLAVTVMAGVTLSAQTTVTYTQQTGNYYASYNNGGATYNNGSTEVGMWANSGGTAKQAVCWRKFKTAGDNSGSDRALQVGDKFTLTVAACRAIGRIGCALLASPSTGSWANRESNYAVSVNLDGPVYTGSYWGVWYIKYKNDSTVASSFGGVQGTYYDYKFEFTLTAPDRMNITVSDNNGHSSSFFDVFLNTSNPITDYSIFLQDDYDDGANRNIYWKQPTSVTNTGAVSLGAGNKSFTVSSAIPNGLDASSTSTVSVNSLTKSGTGTLTLGAGGTYTGATTVAGGSLTLAGGLASSGVTVQNAAVLKIAGTVGLNALTNNAGGTVTVNAGKALTVAGTLTNSAGNSGLVIKSDATGTGSLIHGTSSVQATVERYIPIDLTWHFLSSPVASQAIWPQFAPAPAGTPLNFGASPWNWDFYYWNPNADMSAGLAWVNLRKANGDYNDAVVDLSGNTAGFGSTTPPAFTVGRGYLSAYNTGWATGSPTVHNFSGNLNQGALSCAVVSGTNSFNLAGNPYCSSIDWKAATGWTRGNLALNGGGYDYWIFNDAAGNYGVFNSAGTSGTNGVSQYIAPGQAFFVLAGSSGNLGMTDAVRIHSAQPWLKEAGSDASSISLTVSNEVNSYRDEMIVAFDPSFSAGGSEKLRSFYAEAPEIWTPQGNRELSIVRYTAPTQSLAVPLYVKPGSNSGHLITANHIATFSLSGKVLLEDLKTGGIQNLKENPSYAFMAQPGDDPARFLLHFGEISGTGATVEAPVSIFSSSGRFHVTNLPDQGKDATVTLFNLIGQELVVRPATGSSLSISVKSPPGWYIVKVVHSRGVCSKKVFIH